MRAVVFDQYGPAAEVCRVRDVPKPVPMRGEVLVRMLASPVNPSDLMYISGGYGLKPNLPATPGFEGVGIVEASGGGILGRFRVGKRVAVINDRVGNWSEWTVTTARQVIPVSDDIPDEQAASFFVNPATAVVMTREVLKIPAGAWLLQSAAGGALGKMIVRLGKHDGFRTINLVRRPEQIAELKSLGADEVLLDGDDVPERVRSIVGGDGVQYAIDPIGGSTGSRVVAALGRDGHVLLYGNLSSEPVQVDPRPMISNCKSIDGFWLADWSKRQSIPTLLRLFRRVNRLMRAGVLTTEPSQIYPLEQIREALTRAAAPAGGKVLLRIGTR